MQQWMALGIYLRVHRSPLAIFWGLMLGIGLVVGGYTLQYQYLLYKIRKAEKDQADPLG
jgi:hypothetical protein